MKRKKNKLIKLWFENCFNFIQFWKILILHKRLIKNNNRKIILHVNILRNKIIHFNYIYR